jgi:hypothetical protein
VHGAALEGSAIGIFVRERRAGEALVAPLKIADHRGGRVEGWHEQSGAAERDATGYQPLAQARQYRTEIVAVAALLQNPVDELDHAGSGSDLSAQLSRRLFPICGEDCGNCSKCSGGPGDGKPSRSAGSGASSRKRLWQLNPA